MRPRERPTFLLTFLAWAGGLSGGDRHLLEVARRWRQHVDVAVLAPPQAFSTIQSFVGDVPLYELGSAGARQRRLGPLLALEYVKRALVATARTQPNVDAVLAASHFLPDAAALAAFARRGALGVAYVYHLVAFRPGFRARTLWSKTDERAALALVRRHAGLVFTSNAATEAALRSRGMDPVRTAIGVELDSFVRARIPEVGPRAAYVARMSHTKGVTDAVEAWSRVLRSVPEARLTMVGDGPERERATALGASLGVGNSIEWAGFVSEDEKRRVLSEARVFLAPSFEEGWGISVCEAMASGVPVVAYRLPTLDELFGSAYLGTTPGDVEGLAELAARVLTDDALAETLSRRGRETAARYDVARVAEDELKTILQRLTRPAGGTR